jgi:menaquinone-dependent protoporphyrinogen oxidase
MARILIVYSTVDGHTLRICSRLRALVEAQGHQVDIAPVDAVADDSLEGYDRIVLGASIRYGKHRPAVVDFIRRNAPLLNRKPGAFFSVNVVARKPAKNRPETNPYVRKLLRRIAWRPDEAAVFAGRIDYPSLDWKDRLVIRFIMWLTRGPTDPKAVVEFTNWAQVDAFAGVISRLQKRALPPRSA